MQNVSNLTIPEGEVKAIHNPNNQLLWGRVNYDTKYAGDTAQNGTPTPDAPVAVQTVTGAQSVTVSDGVESQTYPINLGSIELCKIGTYQDYIYKSGDDWYVHKAIEKIHANGTEAWSMTILSGYHGFYLNNTGAVAGSAENNPVLCDHFIPIFSAGLNHILLSGTTIGRILICTDKNVFTNLTVWATWLSSNNTDIYYALATPTDTQITDTTLVGQLNAVHEWLTRYGYNATVSGNLPLIVDRTNL